MPETSTIRRARKAKRQGKAPSTQAGEFVREEIHHVREGKHGARSPEQAIAIGLSKARRSGVAVGSPRAGQPSRKKAGKKTASSARGSSKVASRAALSSHARSAAKRRGPADRSRAAKKAAKTRARRKSSGARKATRNAR